MTLGPNQRGLVRSTLLLLEERLAEVERLLAGPEEGALYRRPRLALTEEQRARVDPLLFEIRSMIRAMRERHGLVPEEQDAVRRIVGLLAISWQELGELTPRRLRAYGRVDPRLEEVFEPERERLAGLVSSLETLVATLASDAADEGAPFDPGGAPS